MSKERERYQYVGASDIAGIVNISPWTSPLSVWHSKMHGRTSNMTDAMYFGTALETFVKNEFRRRNKTLKVLSKKEMRDDGLSFIEHEELPYICGHPDGYFIDDKGEIGILEIKTCSEYSKADWRDGIPDYYFAQVQYYLGIAKLKKAYICCLGGGNEWFQYCIERSDDYVQYLFDKATDFWENNILKGVAPDPTDKDCDRKILGEEIVKAEKEGVVKTTFIDKPATELEDLKSEEKEIKKKIAGAHNKLLDSLEKHRKAESHKFRVEYKTHEMSRLNTKALKEAHPEIYEEFLSKYESSRLNVKEIKNV